MAKPLGQADVAVVGGGIGGLTAAACLAGQGRSVLVLEAGPEPGGYLASFRRGDAVFDACVDTVGSVFDEDGQPGVLGSILEEAGVLGAVEWVELDPIRLQRFPDFTLTVPRGLSLLREELGALLPSERGPVGAALEAMASIHARTRRMLGFPTATAPAEGFRDEPFGVFLGRFGLSARARAALGSYATFVGLEPSRASTRVLSDLWMSYVQGGAWRVRGGFGRLVEALLARLRAGGGDLLPNARVDALSPLGDGVRLSGAFGTADVRRVVWAAAPPGAETGRSSSFSLLYALARRAPEGCLPSTGFFPQPGASWVGSGSEPWGGAFGVSFPAPGEERERTDGLTPLIVHCPVGSDPWSSTEEATSRALLRTLSHLLPPEEIVWHAVATPATLHHRTGNPGGAAYGWEQSVAGVGGDAVELCAGSTTRVTRAGHWAGLGGGVVPAAVTGWKASRFLTGRRLAGK